MPLSFDQIRDRLAARFGEAVGPRVDAKDPFAVVKGDRLLEVSRYLHEDLELRFDYLVDLTAVDYPGESLLRLVLHLWSMPHRHGFKIKVECDRSAPEIASVESVWRGAGWLEREVHDLFGIRFQGHPDLRRILMPEDWVGHPLRKDYREPAEYSGISHARKSLLGARPEREAQPPAGAEKGPQAAAGSEPAKA